MEKANEKKVRTLVQNYIIRPDKRNLHFILTIKNAKEIVEIIPKRFDNAVAFIEYDVNYGADVLRIKSKTRSNIFYTNKIETD